MSNPRLLSVAVTRGDHDDEDVSSQPWYNRTPEVVGASLAALAAIGILVLAISYVARQFSEPAQAPLNYVEPAYSATSSGSATATTTRTVTSTSPPQTTEIGGPLDPSTSTTSSSSETSTSTTSSETPTVEEEEEETDETTERTTRRQPRTNVTRTLNPYP